MISDRTRRMLFGLWHRAQSVQPSLTRDELTLTALGESKSWNDLTDKNVDDLKGAMLAIVEPGNLNAQIHALNGQPKRLLYGIRKLAASMGSGEAYVQGIIDRMDARRGEKPCLDDELDDWERERERGARPQRKLEQLHSRELTKVMVALRKHERRRCVHMHTSDPF